MICADTVEVAVRAPLMAGPKFRYRWAHDQAARTAGRYFEEHGHDVGEFVDELPGPFDVEFLGVRPTLDPRYVLARFGLPWHEWMAAV